MRRWPLIAGVLALGALAGPAVASDPLVPYQSWLPRVVPPGLPAPSGPIPPIAIMENGFDARHPEMQGGWASVRRGWPEPAPNDAAGRRRAAADLVHGTAVASVIGAPRDGVGIEGVLPGAQVAVYGSSALCPDAAKAIIEAVDDGARVINASYGFTRAGACIQHRIATSYAFGRGALVIASAGNSRAQWIQPGNDRHVLSVGALNAFDQPTSFSNQNISVDISAIGEGVFAAVPEWSDLDDGARDGYTEVAGTSFSAPMVAAAAAWVMAERPTLSVDQVAEVLRRSARDIGRPGWDISTGFGALDLGAALREPAPRHDPLEPNDDIAWLNGGGGFKEPEALLRRGRAVAFSGRLDVVKDPIDIYPVWVPARTRVLVTLTPGSIPSDLYVWKPAATVAYGKGAIIKSLRPGVQRDVLGVRNLGGRGARVWVEVRGVRSKQISGSYRLTLRR